MLKEYKLEYNAQTNRLEVLEMTNIRSMRRSGLPKQGFERWNEIIKQLSELYQHL